MNIYLVTKNQGKAMAAQSAFQNTNINILPVDRDYPEIQADTSLEIACHTALQAAKDYDTPAIREDHSLFINALNIPGPYMNFFDKRISAENLLKILACFKDRTGYFEVATAYAEPNGTIEKFVFRVPIFFSEKETGTLQGGWNRIIILENETRTLAEYPEEERKNIWNKNYLAIAKKFSETPYFTPGTHTQN